MCWALKRGEQTIGPVFSTWAHDLARIDGLGMPWLDSPGKAGLDCEYSVQCRLRGSAQLLGHFGPGWTGVGGIEGVKLFEIRRPWRFYVAWICFE